ncbi:MAG: hypothetical protein NTW08_08680 [Gammaproteobacteria bacterium]|nr:hypothetical protein [Gammaproteobacteria bacterium]
MMSKWLTRLSLLLFSVNGFAVPLVSVVALYKAPVQLAKNSFTVAVYKVTNNTQTLSAFAMQPITGVTQVTTSPGACGNPITLSAGQSCQLNLKITGSQLEGPLLAGPQVCNSPQPISCSQPSVADSFNTRVSATLLPPNSWVSVLVAQDPPPYSPTDPSVLATYVNQIISLAPALQQIHLRVTPGATNYSTYVDAITLLRTAYGPSLLVGYHPDASSTSYSGWGCTAPVPPTPVPPANWQCVLNATIVNMNAMNNAVGLGQTTTQGFNIYSLEQSYVIPADALTLRDVKACLNPPDATSGGVCPAGVAIASQPYVKFGWNLPSYGGCVPSVPCEYGTDALDYGYPQFYNLGKRIGGYTNLITNGFFPADSTSCFTAPYASTLNVVDEDNPGSYAPEIPCKSAGQTAANVFTFTPVGGTAPDVPVASAYLAYLMTQYSPISDIPDTHGATVYVTFSGEGPPAAPSLFLGAPGWTLDNILQFYNGINTDFNKLYGQYPPPDPMFANGVFATGITPSSIPYAIWNFDSILANE